MTQREPDDLIRAWFREGPSRGPADGLDRTLADLATTPRARRREIPLPVWVPFAATLAILLAGVMAVGAGFRIIAPAPVDSPGPSATPSATPSTTVGCRLEYPIAGRDAFLVGIGFAPNTDVTLVYDRANGQHIILDATTGAPRTDRTGGFFMGLRPFPEDLGVGRVTVTAGCSATRDIEVTAADLPEPCPDPQVDDTPIVDGGAYRAAVGADAPIAWWHLDDTGATAADAAGGNIGTYVGNVEQSVRSPLSDGGSAYFHHQFPDPTDIELAPVTLSGDFSVEWWMWFCHWADGDAIVGSADSMAGLRVGEGELAFNDGVRVVAWAGEDVVQGAWQHVVFTRAGTKLDFYLNGLPQSTNEESSWTGDLTISEIGIANGTDNYLGYLDEVALYDHALTPQRVAAHARP